MNIHIFSKFSETTRLPFQCLISKIVDFVSCCLPWTPSVAICIEPRGWWGGGLQLNVLYLSKNFPYRTVDSLWKIKNRKFHCSTHAKYNNEVCLLPSSLTSFHTSVTKVLTNKVHVHSVKAPYFSIIMCVLTLNRIAFTLILADCRGKLSESILSLAGFFG